MQSVHRKPRPGTECDDAAARIYDKKEIGKNEPLAIPGTSADQWTPIRILKDISPIPQKPMEVRKRSEQVGKLLTSEEHIALRKDKENEKKLKKHRRKVKQEKNWLKDKKTDTNKNRKRKAVRRISESSSDFSEPVLCGGYMKTVPSLMICAPNVDRRRKKKLNKPNFRAREREKRSQVLFIYPV
ncbi:hypothetical protein HF086_000955 [Spodoptera exigua]|uniref:Uncharacterized protein n=1 Tax=Spodoptera exigua TaxID=7107 RepID=A0A922SIQ6_SPOEX|nr:hypothetical protein HF086_000955 [Spodoptera exigua]